MKRDIRYCGRPLGSVEDGMLRCSLCRVRVDGPVAMETKREFSNHMYTRHADTLKLLEDSADKAFWTCGTPLWSWPQEARAS